MTQPITVYVHAGGPNPKKVLILLEELGIAYEKIVISDPKDESYTKINPNGRLPAIQDPNSNNLILWESAAIMEYIVDTYDKEGRLTVSSAPDKWYLKQYLYFQMSGQGPYYGQFAWFSFFHPEDVPSAKKRYLEQTARVIGVLDDILKGKKYLVADKCTIADIAFVPWDVVASGKSYGTFWQDFDIENKYSNFIAWHKRLMERDSVKKVFAA